MKHEWWRSCRNFIDFASCGGIVYRSIVCENCTSGQCLRGREPWKIQGHLATGLHFKVPFIERVAIRVNLKEQVVDFPPQPVITKDNVTMQIDTVVFFQITDPKLFAYGVVNPLMAIENLTATTLRNIIGDWSSMKR